MMLSVLTLRNFITNDIPNLKKVQGKKKIKRIKLQVMKLTQIRCQNPS
jgi:hypothetical protein